MACSEGSKHVMEASHTVVEIKIKTLDSQVYTCRVEKNVSVPDLKEQVALVTGVPSGSQRLICRGKVLKDEHVLSAYEVEDGHTLHLVTRPAPPSSVSTTLTEAQNEELESHDYSSYNRPGHISHSVLVGTFNFPDRANVVFPEINRILSSVLSSFRVGSFFPPNSGAGDGSSATVQPSANPLNSGQERDGHVDQISEQRVVDHPTATTNQRVSESNNGLSGLHREGGYIGATPAVSHVRIVHQILPNALTTMSQRVNQVEQIFAAYAEQAQILSLDSNISPHAQSNVQPQLFSAEDGHPAAWGSLFRRIHELLGNQAASELLRLASQLETEQSFETTQARGSILLAGMILEQLGRLLLDLGGTAMTFGREPSQPGGGFSSRTEPAPRLRQAAEPTRYSDNDDIAGNMDIHIHAGLPPFFVTRNVLSQATVDGPSLSLNIDGTRDSTVSQSDPELNGNLNAFVQPPSLESVPVPASLNERGTVNTGLPELFDGSSSLENTNGGTGVFYPLLARFQQLNPTLFSRQDSLSLDMSSFEDGSLVHRDLHSGQQHYPSLSVLEAVVQNQAGQMIGDGEVEFGMGEQLGPATSLHLERHDSQPEANTGLCVRPTVEQDFEPSTTGSLRISEDLARPLLQVLEAPPSITSEGEQPIPDQMDPNNGMLRKADTETSLELKCTGQTTRSTEWSNSVLRDRTSLANGHNPATALSVEHGKRFGASEETQAVSYVFPSDEIQSFSCRARLQQESKDCCRMDDLNTAACRGTVLQDFLSTLACRKEETSISERASNEVPQDLSLVLENVENHGFGLDCSRSNAVHFTPLSSTHLITDSSKQKQIPDISLDTMGAPPLSESVEDDAKRTAMGDDRLFDGQRHDDGKGLQQFFPVAHLSNRHGFSPASHVDELEDREAVSMDGGRLLKLQQFSTYNAPDMDSEDLKRHIADSGVESVQAAKRQKML